MPELSKQDLFTDVERELGVTRKVLSAVPLEHAGWKPHEKSMTLMKLALHVATLPQWATHALDRDVLNFADAPRPPLAVATTGELLALFDAQAAALRQAIAAFDPAKWNDPWTMKNGDQVFTTAPRHKVCRTWALNHMVHHRGQLSLYLRLLNVKVPTVYFNTADDPTFVFE